MWYTKSPQGTGNRTPRIGIIGLGYVGLPTALGYANAGNPVIGYDTSKARLATISRGQADLIPEDQELLNNPDIRARITLTTSATALRTCDAILIAVPTPTTKTGNSRTPNLNPLKSACATVINNIRKGQTIILTSTTYIGCTEDLLATPLQARGLTIGIDVYIAYAPERIDPANSTWTQASTPRIVGGITPQCTDKAAEIIAAVAPHAHKVTSSRAAEAAKLLENTYRAVNLALANEFADAVNALGLDPQEIIDAAATKPYGFHKFNPSIGVGGHCIPEDPYYLTKSVTTTMPVVEAAMQKIANRPNEVATRAASVTPHGGRILIAGAAYKPGVEDTRHSPAIEIMHTLKEAGYEIGYIDPLITDIPGIGAPTTDTDWDTVIIAHPELTEQAQTMTRNGIIDMARTHTHNKTLIAA